tara:strand:- start:2638 stop:2904 length:267 start_codon:yes stop_codon:yes gene_type:complete
MIKYKNTRNQPVRLQTSAGTVILQGLDTVELNEDVAALPYFVEKSSAKEKVTPVVEAPVVEAPVVEAPEVKLKKHAPKKGSKKTVAGE